MSTVPRKLLQSHQTPVKTSSKTRFLFKDRRLFCKDKRFLQEKEILLEEYKAPCKSRKTFLQGLETPTRAGHETMSEG